MVCPGAWLNPLSLRNFALIHPKFGLDMEILLSPPAPLPVTTVRLISWATTLLYKPDPTNLRSNWPAQLVGAGASKRNWPSGGPDLSEWETKPSSPQAIRRASSYFLFERWHANIHRPLSVNNVICKLTGLPKLAIKLVVPRLTLVDVMGLYVDLHLAIYTSMNEAVRSTQSTLPGMPDQLADGSSNSDPTASLQAAAPNPAVVLFETFPALSELLLIEFQVRAELSTIDSPAWRGGVAEWGKVPIRRGLFVNMTSEAQSFMGFSWDLAIHANATIPNPSLLEVFKYVGIVASFFSDPIGAVINGVEALHVKVRMCCCLRRYASLSHARGCGELSESVHQSVCECLPACHSMSVRACFLARRVSRLMPWQSSR